MKNAVSRKFYKNRKTPYNFLWVPAKNVRNAKSHKKCGAHKINPVPKSNSPYIFCAARGLFLAQHATPETHTYADVYLYIITYVGEKIARKKH